MDNRKKKAVIISFNEEEYKQMHDALKYTVLSETTLIRLLTRQKIIDKCKNKDSITLEFPLDTPICSSVTKTKIVKFSEEDYKILKSICKCVNMNPSNIIKHFLVPEFERIKKERGL